MGSIRIWRSPWINFNKNEVLDASKVYTDEFLRGVAAAGFNGVWIRGILRELTPSSFFPEFGRESGAMLRSLRTVIRRGEKAGVKVFLYMQPPLGLPENDGFWKKHPEVKGASYSIFEKRNSALCTSTPEVQGFLRESSRRLSERLPGLGGVILITASEHISHCYSHCRCRPDAGLIQDGGGALYKVGCPRCAKRHPREIVADIVGNIRDGLADAGNGASVWAWNWSWTLYEDDPQREVIESLPRDVVLMADFERGGSKTIVGKERVIDEYSLGYAGPSPRFTRSLAVARGRGMRMAAKLQIGTTHELATTPNLPLIGSIYDKARAMRRIRVLDFMGCWNFGNMLTANTAALTTFLDAAKLPPRDKALRDFAGRYMPGCDAAGVARAWGILQEAMDSYPFTIPFIYYGPVNYATVHPIEAGPLRPLPCGRSWMHDRVRGDQLERSFGAFTLDEIVTGLGRVSEVWWRGALAFEAAVASSGSVHAGEELRSILFAAHSFQSAWNIYRAYGLRKEWRESNREALRPILRDELGHLPALVPLLESDARLGFHSEAQHRMVSAGLVRRKIAALRKALGD